MMYCKRGHPFDEVNTYVSPKGKRICRACAEQQRARWRNNNPTDEGRKERDKAYRVANREKIRARNRKPEGHAAKHQAEECNRITRIVKDRLQTHLDFIDGALGAGVEPSPSIYAATAELKALLREIEK